jgi:MGT family glycosyltransferase
MVPVLEELRARGHEVALRTLASEVGAMRALGFEAAAIAPEIEALAMDDWRARTPQGAILRAAATICARAPHDARDLNRAIAAERPDALLVNALAWGALNAAEAWGGPWACSVSFPLPLQSVALPPMGLGLRPGRGPLGRGRDGALRLLASRGFDRLTMPTLAKVRASLDLPARAHSEDMYLAPPLLLYMTATPFEYPRPDWPENVVMVGPCSWEPAGALPPELAEVETPLVLASTSTDFQNDGRLAQVALDALAGEPLHVVVTAPSAGSLRLRVPENATVLGFAPHSPILARCACAITHGGMGSTQKALAHGVPVCAVPFGRDQYEVARRVELSAAGSRLPAPFLRAGRLRRKVRETISRREGAERIARAFAAAGGATAAADAFELRLLS